jgi:hypothetical protein
MMSVVLKTFVTASLIQAGLREGDNLVLGVSQEVHHQDVSQWRTNLMLCGRQNRAEA